MKFWKFSNVFFGAMCVESSKGKDYKYGEIMNNLSFSLTYDVESPDNNPYADLIKPRFMSECILVSKKLKDLLLSFNIFEPYTTSSCTVSSGIEEREYFLFFINGGILENVEHEVDFIHSSFAIHHKISMELYEPLGKGFIKNAQFLRDETRRVIEVNKFSVGRKIRIRPKELVFKRKLDYLFLPDYHYPVISDSLKKSLLKHDITGWAANHIFDDYSINLSEMKKD